MHNIKLYNFVFTFVTFLLFTISWIQNTNFNNPKEINSIIEHQVHPTLLFVFLILDYQKIKLSINKYKDISFNLLIFVSKVLFHFFLFICFELIVGSQSIKTELPHIFKFTYKQFDFYTLGWSKVLENIILAGLGISLISALFWISFYNINILRIQKIIFNKIIKNNLFFKKNKI